LIQVWSEPSRKKLWEKRLKSDSYKGFAQFTDEGRQICISDVILQKTPNECGFYFLKTSSGAEQFTLPSPVTAEQIAATKQPCDPFIRLIEQREKLLITKNTHVVTVWAIDERKKKATKVTYNLLEKDVEALKRDQTILEKSPSVEQMVGILARRCHLEPIQPATP
jgi:hypothetical protein